MRNYSRLTGVLLFAFSSGAAAVADPASISIQDLRPECKERHPAIPAEQCLIDDRLARLDYARRFGNGAVIVLEPAIQRPTMVPPAPRENVNPPATR